jgi:hypothetical protein
MLAMRLSGATTATTTASSSATVRVWRLSMSSAATSSAATRRMLERHVF